MQLIEDLINYSSESPFLDFKQGIYHLSKNEKKHEFLKDISAMANHPSNDDKYIIIGIKEKDGRATGYNNISDFQDEAKYQQFLHSNIEPEINFSYQTCEIQGNRIAFFKISKNSNRPYLFKKDVFNFLHFDKLEFREGDGFIRVGTTTRKMKLSDFDNIYDKKYKNYDRKEDIDVRCFLKSVEQDELSGVGLQYIDISIENLSNKSIALEAEMRVIKNINFKLFTEHQLKNEMREKKERRLSKLNPLIHINHSIPSFTVHMKEHDTFYEIIKSKLAVEKNSIVIAQKKIVKDIFDQYIAVIHTSSVEIEVEVILRSDDFTDGLYRKNFRIKAVPPEE